MDPAHPAGLSPEVSWVPTREKSLVADECFHPGSQHSSNILRILMNIRMEVEQLRSPRTHAVKSAAAVAALVASLFRVAPQTAPL